MHYPTTECGCKRQTVNASGVCSGCLGNRAPHQPREKIRRCLRCDARMKSESAAHRRCPQCETVVDTMLHAPERVGPRPQPHMGEINYSDDEREFMTAMDKYKREKRRPFPQWSEVLEVLRGLGYQKLNGVLAGPEGKDSHPRTAPRACKHPPLPPLISRLKRAKEGPGDDDGA